MTRVEEVAKAIIKAFEGVGPNNLELRKRLFERAESILEPLIVLRPQEFDAVLRALTVCGDVRMNAVQQYWRPS